MVLHFARQCQLEKGQGRWKGAPISFSAQQVYAGKKEWGSQNAWHCNIDGMLPLNLMPTQLPTRLASISDQYLLNHKQQATSGMDMDGHLPVFAFFTAQFLPSSQHSRVAEIPQLLTEVIPSHGGGGWRELRGWDQPISPPRIGPSATVATICQALKECWEIVGPIWCQLEGLKQHGQQDRLGSQMA